MSPQYQVFMVTLQGIYGRVLKPSEAVTIELLPVPLGIKALEYISYLIHDFQ